MFPLEHWGEAAVALRDALTGKRSFDSVKWSTEPDQRQAVAKRTERIGYFGLYLPADLKRAGTPRERTDLETLYQRLNRHSWTGFDIIVPISSSFVREYRLEDHQEEAFHQDRDMLVDQLGIDVPKRDSVILLDAGGEVGVIDLPRTTRNKNHNRHKEVDDGLRSVARAMAAGATAAQAAAVARACQGPRRKWSKPEWSGVLDAWDETLSASDEWRRSVAAGADNEDRVELAERRDEEKESARAARRLARAWASVSTIVLLTSTLRLRPESAARRSAADRGAEFELVTKHQVEDIDLEVEPPDWFASEWSGATWPPEDNAYKQVGRALAARSARP